jgi:hypothetical protein
MVFTHTYILARVVLCAPLAHNDISGHNPLPAKNLYPQPFTF